MHVRISPDEGDVKYFELELEYSRLTTEIKQVAQEVIHKETGIEPDKQNAVFLPQIPDAKDIKKLVLPSDVEQLVLASTHRFEELSKKYPEILHQSTVYVSRISDWKEDDLRKPENRVEIKGFIEDTGMFLKALYSELNRPRTVDVSLLDQFPDFRKGIEQDLTGFLAPTASQSTDAVISHRELECYVDIFHDIEEGVCNFDPRTFDSSPLHAMFFGSMMVQPPFFWDRHRSREKLEMAADRTSRLRMYIKKSGQSDVYKFTPRSDIVVIDKSSSLPALICEVDSHVTRKDRTRMIFQGAVACRQWRYILPESLKKKNRLLGLFVHQNFNVDLYLFHADDNYTVQIFRQVFSLHVRNEALRLARILFNYRDKFLDVAGLSEREKAEELGKLVYDSKVLPSYTTTKKDVPTRKSRSINHSGLATVPETHSDSLLLTEKVQSLLCPDGAYLQPTEHEYVAAVRMIGIPSKTLGFVKLTNKHELRAFDTIRNSGSEFLLSRVVLPTKVIEIDEYSVAFLPYGGEPLHHSWGLKDGPAGHETEIAWDLLTIISRLHELQIAHLDIKPSNILWDPSTLSIRIIDFDSSQKLDPNGSRKVRGIVGTPGYAAPEVESKEGLEYDPFLADAFSCGRVLSDVVMSEEMTEEARFVDEICKALGKGDVHERWSINKAIMAWTNWLKNDGHKPKHAGRCPSNDSHLFSSMKILSTVRVH